MGNFDSIFLEVIVHAVKGIPIKVTVGLSEAIKKVSNNYGT